MSKCMLCGQEVTDWENHKCDGGLKDSGGRTEFESGAVRDVQKGKGRFDLLPTVAVRKLIDKYAHPNCYTEAYKLLMEFLMTKDPNKLIDAYVALAEESAKVNSVVVAGDSNKLLAHSFMEIAKQYEAGATKYGERNWEKGIPLHSFIDSALRHLTKVILEWEDENHLRAALWNLAGAIWTLEVRPELDDIEITKGLDGEG